MSIGPSISYSYVQSLYKNLVDTSGCLGKKQIQELLSDGNPGKEEREEKNERVSGASVHILPVSDNGPLVCDVSAIYAQSILSCVSFHLLWPSPRKYVLFKILVQDGRSLGSNTSIWSKRRRSSRSGFLLGEGSAFQ